MKISIAMATYNGAKYLQEQLDSFVAQTRWPDELVVCDDCSSDETVAILQRFAETAPFEVKIFLNEENLGYAQNFSRALSLCKGDLVFLSDQDDVWFPDKITTMETIAIDQPDYQLFMNDAELVHENLSPTGLTKQGQIKSAGMTDSSFVMGCCMAIRRNFLQHILPVPLVSRDHDGWISRLAEGLQQRYITSQILQNYRRYEGNTSMFLANKTRRVNRVDLIYSRLHKKIKNKSLADQQADVFAVVAVTEEMIKVLDRWLAEEIDKRLELKIIEFQASLEAYSEALKYRLSLKNMSFIQRIIQGFYFYRRGGYQDFSGFFSYVIDIVS